MFRKPNHPATLGFACAVSLALFAACGDDGSSPNGVESAGTGASGAGASATAGKSGSSAAGTTGAAGATAGRGMPAAGSGVAGAAGRGGRGGSGGGSGSATDDDAGVSPGGGSGGSSGSAGSSGASAGTGGRGGAAAGSGGSGAAAATFTEVYAIFTASCMGANCHVGATRPGDMLSFADKATAYMNLVGVNAVSCAGEKRVVAGDPTKSELVHALAHTRVGNCTRTPQMPDNKPMLSASDIEKVRSWVQAGAKND